MTESRGQGAYNRPTGTGARGHETAGTPTGGEMEPEQREFSFWQDRSRIFLQPIAAPSILGLFGLATATMMVGAWMARWYGGAFSPVILFPFILTAGGLAQLLAGMWSYRARDGLATAVHGIWGAFWLAFGLMFLMVAAGAFPVVLAPRIGVANPPFAFWFIALCVITALCALAATAQSMGLTLMLILLSVASGLTAAGFFAGASWPIIVAGWLFVAAAATALYVAAAMMMEGSFGRTILPLGKYSAAANIPGRRITRPLEYKQGQPGVKIGQ
ncbi:GPR1/FUN34/YaaH family transporter [Actinoallomurus spadix]|uniref:GPR1/FUN34/yaaH family protein n=2 Tax=Actinoallomurus spadix TaxID=79912 RepID=A0ABN0XQF8_9ACTN|nr:GPR1/FUN34/YaaH family transporter [Actinoallomurus spadix]MCO5988349.1 GPR1/FUN34/YaaH family transporter [Actinoallomurus spadix]